MDKSKIYKAGYKQGAVIPRTIITQNKRFIKYFRVFCFKACAAEEMPRIKGLLERFIFIPMVEGFPRKDWADFDKEDEKRLRELRNMLLKWRLESRNWELTEIDLPVKGRLKELWKPILQVVSGLTVEKDLRAHLEQLQKERLNEKANTLEGHIVKVVCELYGLGQPMPFSAVWDELARDLEGKLFENKPNKMDTPEFGEVTKQKIGYRLREVLSGKKANTRGQNGAGRIYNFDPEKLRRIAKKYGVAFANKLTSETSSKGVSAHSNTEKCMEDLSCSMEKANGKQADTPPQLDKLVNSFANLTFEDLASKTKEITRLTTDFGVETCILCSVKARPDWQVTLFDDS